MFICNKDELIKTEKKKKKKVEKQKTARRWRSKQKNKTKYIYSNKFIYIFIKLLHRLAVRISLPFSDFLQVIIVLIQVYNWEIRHHSTVCRCGLADILYFNLLMQLYETGALSWLSGLCVPVILKAIPAGAYTGRYTALTRSFFSIGGESNRTNNTTMDPSLENNRAAWYPGPMKLEGVKRGVATAPGNKTAKFPGVKMP